MSDVYVAFPAGSKTDGEVIAPATTTGRQSGNWLRVILTAGGLSWPQWVHIDNILFEDEVDEA